MLDRRHGDRVLRLHAPDTACCPNKIRVLDVRTIGFQVARRDRDVDRLDDDPALPMQDPERVCQLQDVAKCLDVAVAPTTFKVGDVRGAGDRSEIDHIVAHMQVALRIAGVQIKAFRHVREGGLDDIAPQSNHLRLVINQSAGSAENIACCEAADLEARLLENPECRYQDLFELRGAQDFQRRPAVDEPWQWRE